MGRSCGAPVDTARKQQVRHVHARDHEYEGDPAEDGEQRRPDAARQYGELKKHLAQLFPNDIDSYVFGKTDFILDVLRRVGLTEEQLASIERVNRRS